MASIVTYSTHVFPKYKVLERRAHKQQRFFVEVENDVYEIDGKVNEIAAVLQAGEKGRGFDLEAKAVIKLAGDKLGEYNTFFRKAFKLSKDLA